jgi:predicted AlkP superfamily phosphohydrolase/phosphomutase
MRKCFSQNGSTASLSRPSQALAPIDWRRSRAVALHGNLGGLIYLNTRRRFGCGPLVTPRQCEQALDETIAAFVDARHPATGEVLFEEVYSTERRYGADPLTGMWPDVVAIPAAGFHTQHKFDPSGELCRPDSALNGTHRLEGVLMINSPDVTLGHSLTADLRDVAPTILHLLNLPAPATMQGRVLDEILPQRELPSPSSKTSPRFTLPSAGISAAEQVLVEARLRDLGYME